MVVASRSSPGAKNRFILKDGRLHRLPSDPLGMLLDRSPLTKGLVWAGVSEALSFGNGGRAQGGDDESIFAFAARKFGPQFAENLFDPMCHGIYAGDARELSLRSCFPAVYEAERARGSVVRGFLFPTTPKAPAPAPAPSLGKEEDGRETAAFVEKMSQYPMWSFKDGLEVVSH